MNMAWDTSAPRARTSASRLLRCSLMLVLACSLLSQPAFAARYALLIGISDYKYIPDMDGPVNDVTSLRELLSAHWEFEHNNIITLLDAQATKIRIEAELARLVTRSQPGDHIFIYYSGHGTSRLDARSDWPLPYTTGALIPFEFEPKGNTEQQLSQLVVGRWELKPLLEALDKGERSTFVVIDACFSGNTVRSQSNNDRLARRYFPLTTGTGSHPSLTRGDSTRHVLSTFRTGSRNSAPYPYSNVFFLSASGEHEFASDITVAMLSRFPTVDGKPHGAFTDAMLRALAGQLPADTNQDNRLSYSELHRAVRRFMDARGYPQTPRALPVLDSDTYAVLNKSVFGWATIPAVAKPQHTESRLLAQARKGLVPVRDNLSHISGVQPTNQDSFTHEVMHRTLEKLLIPGSKSAQRFNIMLDLSGSRQAGMAIEGEKVSFSIVSEKDAYLLLLAIDPIGDINVIYPSQESHLKPVKAGKVLRIPEENAPDSAIIQPPFGREHIIAVAFTRQPKALSQLLGAQIDALSPEFVLLEKMITDGKADRAYAVLQLETIGYSSTGRVGR